MRILQFIILVMLVLSCNSTSEKEGDTKDTAKKINELHEPPMLQDTLFYGFGTEPFWALYLINNKNIIFHPADGDDIVVPFVTGTLLDSLTKVYNSFSEKNVLDIKISKMNCSDGMSEEIHPFTVRVTINDGIKYTGCGRGAKQ